MKLILQRETLHPATIGHLSLDGVMLHDTLERPWLDNQMGISCIPAGTYSLVWEFSPRLGRNTLRLKSVPDRWGILIHPANHANELRGCIALGKRLSPDTIMESRIAVEDVETRCRAAFAAGDGVTLEIKDPVNV